MLSVASEPPSQRCLLRNSSTSRKLFPPAAFDLFRPPFEAGIFAVCEQLARGFTAIACFRKRHDLAVNPGPGAPSGWQPIVARS
jgi:hypothetical protein